MIDVGQYQNQIPTLSALVVKDYERIFKIFRTEKEDKNFYFYNILRKVDFPEIDSSFLGYYDVQARTPLTTVSFNIYGDIKSWWILYTLNRDKFEGAPFYAEAGTQLKYITDELRSAIYQDITQATVYGGRHY